MEELLKRIGPYKNIIWDWNGTLLNDYAVNKKAISYQLKEHDLPVPTDDEFKEIFCFPIRDFYQRLGFRFNHDQFIQLAKSFMKTYQTFVTESSLHEGTKHLLREFSLDGKRQFVLSASEQSYLRTQVVAYQIAHFFEKVVGHDNIYGGSKVELGKSLMNEQNLIDKETILIGDTDHDYEVACALGVESLLIAEGNQSYSKLKRTHYNVLRHRL